MKIEKLQLDDRFGKEYEGEYLFGEITWAKRNRIIQKYTEYNPLSGQVKSSDFIAIQAETIWASLKEQPEAKPISLEKLLSEDDGIPIGLGELFSEVVNRLNAVTVQEQRFLSEPSEDKDQTQQSLSSACAKSSVGHRTNSEEKQQKPSNNSS